MLPHPPPPPALIGRSEAVQIIWRGRSHGYRIVWTPSRLAIKPESGGQAIFEVQDLEESDEARGIAAEGGKAEEEYKLLSVVGPLVTIHSRYYLLQGNGTPSSGGVNIQTLDLSRQGKPADLRDWFPEQDILAAMLTDPLVTKVLAKTGGEKPATLAALLDRLHGSEDEEGLLFNMNLLHQFAFHHLEGGSVAVRLPAWTTRLMSDNSVDYLGLLLPAPRRLAPALQEAAHRKHGFLWKDLSRVSGGQTASW